MEITKLEEEREMLLKEIGLIKEMRRGSVTEQFLSIRLRDKKKPTLRGPYYVHTTKVGGKTISKRLKLEELEKYRMEVKNFRHFQELIRRLIETNEDISDFKPTNEVDGIKKKLQKPSKGRLKKRLMD